MGFDLSYFKAAFLERRISVRMKLLKITKGSEYAKLIADTPDEITSLYDSLSINVTRFYRDKQVWKIFSQNIIPKLLDTLKPADTLKIWSAGCASGEEPYSLAILFHDALKNTSYKFKILATDINSVALQQAQNGIYTSENLKNLAPNLISENFTKLPDGNYQINQDIKELINFSLGDIVTFPTSRLDVIFCRNLLIYYGRDAQDLIFKKFYNSLKIHGFLVLGMDETLWGHPIANSFETIYPRERIYKIKSKIK
jgi:chemotaxis methyl-accepting protein methylase